MENKNLETEFLLLAAFENHRCHPSKELIDDIVKMIETKKRESFNQGFKRGYFSGTSYMENNDLGCF